MYVIHFRLLFFLVIGLVSGVGLIVSGVGVVVLHGVYSMVVMVLVLVVYV